MNNMNIIRILNNRLNSNLTPTNHESFNSTFFGKIKEGFYLTLWPLSQSIVWKTYGQSREYSCQEIHPWQSHQYGNDLQVFILKYIYGI